MQMYQNLNFQNLTQKQLLSLPYMSQRKKKDILARSNKTWGPKKTALATNFLDHTYTIYFYFLLKS